MKYYTKLFVLQIQQYLEKIMDILSQLIPNQNAQSQKQQQIKQKQQGVADAPVAEQKPAQIKNTQMQKILFSLLDFQSFQAQKQKNVNPQMIRVKNNLLLVLLILSAYGVYYLIGDFLDILLVAYIAGIAYNQSRQGFTKYITSKQTYEGPTQPFLKRFVKAIIWLGVGFIFPRLRFMLKNPQKIKSFPTFKKFVRSISKTNSFIVVACQILIGIYIIKLLLGPQLNKIFIKIRPKSKKFVRFLFSIIMLIAVIGIVIIVPTILFRQVSNTGNLIEQKVEEQLGCSILSSEQNQTLPLCTEKISSQNQFIRSTIVEFKEQNKTLEDCLLFLEKIQDQYLSEYIKKYQFLQKNIYDYDDIVCTWYSFIDKAMAYGGFKISTDGQDLNHYFSTGTNIFKLFFGNLTWILSILSSSVFNITTFITTFMLTTKVEGKSSTIKQIFSQNKQQLISSITNLIQATFFIVIYHFILSYMLLQIFAITPINLVLSTLLASMAMFPFFRPWLGALIIISIRILITQQYYVSLFFVVIYYALSERIYSIHYRKMELHEIITNMSVLFGIYQFGVAGIIYGPLIVITYRCVQRELFRSYLNFKN